MSTNANALPALLTGKELPLSNSIIEFRAAHTSGRVVTEKTDYDAEQGYVVFYASIFRQEFDLSPAATAHCEGRYESNPDWLEKAEETAIARALFFMGYGDGKRVFAAENSS